MNSFPYAAKYNGDRSRIALILLAILVYCFFAYVYGAQIQESYAKYRFSVRPLDLLEYGILFLFYLLPLFFLPTRRHRPSDVALWLLYLLAYSPAMFMGFYSLKSGLLQVLQFYTYLLAGLLTLHLSRLHPVSLWLGIAWARGSYLHIGILTLCALSIVYLFSLTDYTMSLDMATLHERRLAARADENPVGGYLFSQARAVIYVLGIYLLVVKRDMFALGLVLMLALVGFSYDGTKTSILMPVALSILAVFVLRSRHFGWLLLGACCAILLGIIETWLVGTVNFNEYFIRRMYAVSGQISAAYYEYFSSHAAVLMTDSIGRYFIDPVYDVTAGYVIGREYFNDPFINANTNLWLGGFAHFGLIGIVLSSAAAGFILGLVDNTTRDRYLVLGSLVCAYFGFKWAEQLLHTSMLSGGVMALVILVLIAAHSRELEEKWGQPSP